MFDAIEPVQVPADAGAGLGGAVEQERARLARELHDDLVQSLFVAKVDCAWLRQNLLRDPQRAQQRLMAVQLQLESCATSVRRITSGLRPAVLANAGLAPAVRRLGREFRERTGVLCEVSASGAVDAPEPFASMVFRVVQESLANVRRHAAARHVMVRVSRRGEFLSFSVRDDGRGFLIADQRHPDAMGITGMEERARLAGADLVISSAPGQGTVVAGRVRIPQRADAAPRPGRSRHVMS